MGGSSETCMAKPRLQFEQSLEKVVVSMSSPDIVLLQLPIVTGRDCFTVLQGSRSKIQMDKTLLPKSLTEPL